MYAVFYIIFLLKSKYTRHLQEIQSSFLHFISKIQRKEAIAVGSHIQIRSSLR
uniref:Uncharacterized protein n=1 Tax=Anguilla anguilla TaxID=7936 RepID=A0A0E9WLP4_ANGAN